MTNFIHALNLATDLAKYMFPDISDNRPKGGLVDGTPDHMMAYILRNLQTDKLSALRTRGSPQAGCTRAQIVSYGEQVLAQGDVGNCMEIACAAAFICQTRYNVRDWNLIYYTGGADHIFLAIGDTGDVADDFSTWPDTCAIFDGWAQIACMAPNYATKWSAKMSEWTSSIDKVDLPSLSAGPAGDATAWRPIVSTSKAVYHTD